MTAQGSSTNTKTARQSPTVWRRRLGSELRRLREDAGLTIDKVAEILECSDSKISRVETGQVGPTPRDVRDMLEIYGVTGKQRDKLIQIAREARQKGWWLAYRDAANTAKFVGYEAAAASIRIYEALVVPGLFQTAEYAQAVFRAARPTLRIKQLESRIGLRMARQSLLTQADPPQLWAVLDESVLRRLIGGRECMREQLDRLGQVAALPTVTLQILPFMAADQPGIDGAFTIFSFAERIDPDVVYIENFTDNDLHLHGVSDIRLYKSLFDRLRAAALSPSDSAALITTVAKEWSIKEAASH